jgi:rhamnosyltransferase subunit B
MAHILLASWGTFGDIYPFIGLGRTLQSRGHRATLIANEHFERHATGAGLNFAKMGSAEQYERNLRDPDLWNPQRAGSVLARMVVEPVLEGVARIEELGKDNDTIIVASRWAFAALMARDKLRIPTCTLLLNLTSLSSIYSPPKLPGMLFPKEMDPSSYKRLFDPLDRWMEGHLAPPINRLRTELGLQPIEDFLPWWNRSDRVIAAWPDWLYSRQSDWPNNAVTVGFIEYEGLPPVNSNEKPLVQDDISSKVLVFTAGTGMLQAADFYGAAAAACNLLNRPGILLTQYKEQIPNKLPPLVRHIDYAPLNELLSKSAAVIHHGGIGTSATGLRAGVPQVIVPMAHDQFENAQRLTSLGVASTVDRGALSPETLALSIGAMISSDTVAERCGYWAKQMCHDSVTQICRLVEDTRGSAN